MRGGGKKVRGDVKVDILLTHARSGQVQAPGYAARLGSLAKTGPRVGQAMAVHCFMPTTLFNTMAGCRQPHVPHSTFALAHDWKLGPVPSRRGVYLRKEASHCSKHIPASPAPKSERALKR